MTVRAPAHPGAQVAARPPVAWRPVLALAAGVGVIMLVTSAWYGPFGDEMYFLSAGARPAAGYADQPPLLPLLAHALDALAPHSLVVLRLPSTLATAASVVVAALLAAEMGGRGRAQVVAGLTTAMCPYLLATGHLLATSTVDPLLWSVLLWLVARWTRGEREGRADDRLLLLGGLVVAVALFDKVLVPVLLGALAVGVAVAGPRRLLRRPLLWVGLVAAAASTVPTLLWQAANGWPQLRMQGVVAGETGLFGDRWQFLPRALWYAGLLPGAVLAVVGLWALLRRDDLRPWRGLGVTVVVAVAVLLAGGGRPYYVTGLYALLFAAAVVALQARTTAIPRWWRWTLHPVSFAVSAVVVLLWTLPIGPAAWRTGYDFEVMGQVGWPELADTVAARYTALPPDVRDRTSVVAYSYWYAAALEYEGPARGLPRTVFSTHRGFGYFAPPPDGNRALLVGKVRWAEDFCRELVVLPPHHGPRNDVNDDVPISLCTPRAPWSAAWPSLRNLA